MNSQLSFETHMLLQVANNAVKQEKTITHEQAIGFLSAMSDANLQAMVLVVDTTRNDGAGNQYFDDAGQYADQNELTVRSGHEFFTHLFFTHDGMSIVYCVPSDADSIMQGSYYRIS